MRLLLVAFTVLLTTLALAQQSCFDGASTDGTLCPQGSSGDASANSKPEDVKPCPNPVQCFADPCAFTPKSSATCNPVRCESNYCGSCTATWYDGNSKVTCAAKPCEPAQCGEQPVFAQVMCPDGKSTASVGACEDTGKGCQWTIKECPPIECPVPDCIVNCKLGYLLNSHGCQTCECKQAEICPAIACAAVDFTSCMAAGGWLTNSGCCTTCTKPSSGCAAVQCPAVDCPIPAAGQQTTIRTDGCCPSCEIIDCKAVLCAAPNCAEGSKIYTPPGNCCPTCATPPQCKDVACAQLVCSPITNNGAQIASVKDGECCPQCNPKPNCELVDCFIPKCGPDQELIVKFGECCGTCVDKNACNRVLCADPDCPFGYQERPAGECCATCSYCRQQLENGGIVCTKDGQPICDPAFAGPTCTVPMPADQYTQVCKAVSIAVNSAAWLDLSSDTNCKFSTITQLQGAAPVLASHPEKFNCKVISNDGATASVRYCVRVAKGDTSVSAESATNEVDSGLYSAPGVNGSAASSLAVIISLMLVVTIVLF